VDAVALNTRITRRIPIHLPLCSSPMDTVTEEKMAVSMALLGGVGIIHCHCPIDEQCRMVRHVKRFENGFIAQPACLKLDDPIR
jgi:IMP dehydrogenase